MLEHLAPVRIQGIGLCHGISGNAYALLFHANTTGDDLWRRRAEQFGLFTAAHWQELYDVPDAAASLYQAHPPPPPPPPPPCQPLSSKRPIHSDLTSSFCFIFLLSMLNRIKVHI